MKKVCKKWRPKQTFNYPGSAWKGATCKAWRTWGFVRFRLLFLSAEHWKNTRENTEYNRKEWRPEVLHSQRNVPPANIIWKIHKEIDHYCLSEEQKGSSGFALAGLDHDRPIYPSLGAGVTDVCHHTQLNDWDRVWTVLALYLIFLMSAPWGPGITDMSHSGTLQCPLFK
jgi:hypothetical protein